MTSEKSRQKLLARFSKKSKYSSTCGDLVFQELIGTETIRVYANGYISVGGVFKETEPEKLLSINIDVQTAKKTGLGRAVAAGLTAGLNLATGNIRGDVYVAIQTDKSSKMVHSQFPTSTEVSELRRLEVITQQMLERRNQPEVAQPAEDIALQLSKLGELAAAGLLSDEEFTAAKSKLLGI